uniref:Secreted protein n=1 Tax=Romanomermis culicivorax TaxID=13658 RepID=A0A915IFW2_ROMCU
MLRQVGGACGCKFAAAVGCLSVAAAVCCTGCVCVDVDAAPPFIQIREKLKICVISNHKSRNL